jgi:site-specific DNA-methyltransferase (adenine-specific)
VPPRVETIGDCTLHLGDCREILPTLGRVDAVVTDPPYGMKRHGRYQRGALSTSGTAYRSKTKMFAETIEGDSEPFDPSFLMGVAEKSIIWGANHFARHLPVGTTLVWLKRLDSGFGTFMSDAEVAWMSGGHGVYCRRDISLQGEHERDHPTPKPLGIMKWCLEKLPSARTILDPFMGSGTTGVACAKLGRKFIGVEIDEGYFNVACLRIAAAYAQPDLFVEPPTVAPQQTSMFDTHAQHRPKAVTS